ASQWRRRQSHADLPEGVPEVQQLRRRALRRMSFAGEIEASREERCELGLCDGSGFVVDEATDTASDCACRAGRIARRRAAGLEGRIPRHYRGVSFERPPVPEI